MFFHEPDFADPGSEQHQVFAQHPNALGDIAEFFRQADRLPHAPEILAARCSRRTGGELAVLGYCERPIVGAECALNSNVG